MESDSEEPQREEVKKMGIEKKPSEMLRNLDRDTAQQLHKTRQRELIEIADDILRAATEYAQRETISEEQAIELMKVAAILKAAEALKG